MSTQTNSDTAASLKFTSNDQNDIEAQTKSKPFKKFVEGDAGDGTNRFDQQQHGIKLVLSLASCAVAMFLISLDQTIIFTTLTTIGDKWGSYGKIGWITSGFMLTRSLFAQIWGKVSISFGRKPSFLFAIFIFEVGSLVCAVADGMDMLIAGRVVSGIGAAGIQAFSFIVASELVPISQRSKMFALLGVVFGFSSVIGPLLGGVFTDRVSWRWCFYINLPLGGAASFILYMFFNPPSPKLTWTEKFANIDFLGMFLLVGGLVIFLLALTMGGQEFEWHSGAIISMFVIGILLMIAFSVWNFKYSTKQIIPTAIMTSVQVLAAALATGFSFMVFMSSLIYLTTYLQILKGYDALETGIHFFPMVIPMVIASIGTGISIRKTRYVKPFALAGGVFSVVGTGIATLFTIDGGLSQIIGYQILPSLSLGLIMQAGMIASQISAPKSPGGVIMVSTFMNFLRSLGGCIGAALAQVIYNTSLKEKITEAYTVDVFKRPLSDVVALVSSPSSIRALPPSMRDVVFKCVLESIRNVYYFSTGVGALMLISALFMTNKRLPKDEDVEKREDYAEDKTEDQVETSKIVGDETAQR